MPGTKRNAADGISNEAFDAFEVHALQKRCETDRHFHHREACPYTDARPSPEWKVGGSRDELVTPFREPRNVELRRIPPQVLMAMNGVNRNEQHRPRRELVSTEGLWLDRTAGEH